MTDQIKADFLRIRKSKLMYVILIGQFLISLFMIRNQISNNEHYETMAPGDVVCLSALISYGTLLGYMMGLVSLKLSILEKRDGLLRNKVMTGTSRVSIFLSKVIVNYIISAVLFAIHMGTVITVSAIEYKGLLPGFGTLMEYAGICLLWMIFFSAMMAMLALCLTSDVISTVLTFLVVSVLPTLPGSLDARMEMPKYYGTFIFKVFKFIKSIIPYTYMIPEKDPGSVAEAFRGGIIPALALAVIFITLGCLSFRRKEFN